MTSEVNEMNRQMKLVKNYTDSKFEEQISFAQKENFTILCTLKGNLAIKSALIFSTLTSDLSSLTDKFFTKKFQSV
jgi:hypothetical protein